MTEIALRIKNAGASVAIVGLACAIFVYSPYNDALLSPYQGPAGFAITGYQFLLVAGIGYAALVLAFFASEPAPAESKSLRFFALVWRLLRHPAQVLREPLPSQDRLAVLTTLLKIFFAPMMATSLMGFCMGAWNNAVGMIESGLLDAGLRQIFDRAGFWIVLQVILFIDVLVFTVGYLVESKRLGNEIRSVDSTLLGWAAALLCYPPLNIFAGAVLGSQVSTQPRFDDATVHAVLNTLMLVLLAGYTSASLALGLKASNLTHRGIVDRGPYRWVRHPAYLFKNMAWWIGALPLVGLAFDKSWLDGLQSLGSVAGWTGLYVLRALTEEDHLRRVDASYAEYASRVRYRFVPGLF